DQAMPYTLANLKRLEVLLGNWSARSEENARRAKDDLFGFQNSRKAYDGRIAGLLDPEQFGAKVKAETDFKSKLAGSAEFADALAAYDKIAEATKTLAAQARRSRLLEGGAAFNCESFHIARTLLRARDQ